MRLKSIKLAGFKSFVDATTVPFTTNMTAIVGPNGCGKSNIIDAVRWVMGESSAKNLRGESMTDVIFNGSSGRQPVGQASIELLFDNSEGRLTGEYAGFSEISIRRKVTREGVSQYYLNGTKCRRRDVTDIFLGTGMGPRSYAIIEQGMISKLIESKPEDLRVYLEEAAGISKYKERRRETENRMRRTQDNLDRLSDIREELGKQLQNLKRQANAAERYAEYKQEQRLSAAKLNTLKWQTLSREYNEKLEAIKTYELKIEDSVLAKNTNENKVDSLKSKLEEEQASLQHVQAKYYQSGTEIATLEQQLQFQKHRLSEQKNSLSQLEEELAEIEESSVVELERLEQLNLELEELLFSLEEAVAAAETLAIEYEEKNLDLTRWQENWEEFNQKQANARQAAEISQSKIQDFESRTRELGQRKERLKEEQSQLNSQLEADELVELQENLCILEEKHSDLLSSIEQKMPILEATKNSFHDAKQEQQSLSHQQAEKKAILASLKVLQEGDLNSQGEGYLNCLKSLELDKYPSLIEGLDVQPGWESAVEQVLGNWISSRAFSGDLKINSVDFCEKLIASESHLNLVSQAHYADYTNAPSNTLAACVKGMLNIPVDFTNILIADSIPEALSLFSSLVDGQSIITKQGLWLSSYWVRFAAPGKQEDSLLHRSKLIQELEEQLIVSQEKYSQLDITINDMAKLIESDQLKIDTLQQEKRILDQEIRKQENAIFSSQTKQDQLKQGLKRINEDLNEIALQHEHFLEQLEIQRASWQTAMANLDAFVDERDRYLSHKESILSVLETSKHANREARDKVHQLQMLKQQKESQKLLIDQNVKRLNAEKDYRQNKIQQISSGDAVDESIIEDLALQLEGLLETRLVNEQKLNDVRKRVEEISHSLREEELKRNNFEAHISAARDALTAQRMEAQALFLTQKNLVEKIKSDDYQVQEIVELLTAEDTESVLEEILIQLEQKITRLGSINLAAIEEYQVQSERKAHLDEQHEDLIDALDTLMSAIKKIDKETRTRFKETYDQVNEGLQKLFPKIFGGGSAYLELTDDNLLETGVQIIARPPGKKNATIHLLSGGEKSLTAIALIFAIFELNPAPFCMLDEVDAPLDDANVGRFANIVKEMSSQVQFIYISHNKVSMERADQLMGVTMHEPGVSRLVSVDIEQAAAMVESV